MVKIQSRDELSTTKYIIKANIEIDGIVEKPDIVGAIFGQTEGLLGDDLDLRELQKTGRIGRIQVEVNSEGGHSTGSIIIPSSLNKVETSILAAGLEAVDRVGPCSATITIDKLEDIRKTKREMIIARAAELLKTWEEKVLPESQEISDEVIKSVRIEEIQKYGSENLPAGPEIDQSETIIVVEGRADVLNLLKYGYKNIIAVEGTNIPQTIIDLTQKKTIIAFVDGDRGGELILKELKQRGDIDFIARAPMGKEVEDLTRKEIIKALRNKIPAEAFEHQGEKEKVKKNKRSKHQKKNLKEKTARQIIIPEPLISESKNIQQTLKAKLFDDEFNTIDEVSVSEIADKLPTYNNKIRAIVFDGLITQRLVDISIEKGLEYLLGVRIADLTKKPANLKVFEINRILSDEKKEGNTNF
ncbi:MAG: DNA primase DnaG [Candidatus Helarchaeota archaeon]